MRVPTRAVAIIIKDNDVLLMERRNQGKQYYVFPGGGVESGETIEQAVLREVMEETTLTVTIEKKLYIHYYDSQIHGKSEQHFYLCRYISGETKLGDANEKEEMQKGTDYYNPEWISMNNLSKLLVYPLEIRDWLLEDRKNNFINTPREAHLKVEQLRDKI